MNEPISHDQLRFRLQSHPGWRLGDDGKLHADYIFGDFGRAMLFANAVAHLAEERDHHPDILIHGYKHVRLSLTSHDVGGITDRDFALMERIRGLGARGSTSTPN